MTAHQHDAFRMPAPDAPTPNELAWISLLRDLSSGRDPVPTLAVVQTLRAVLT